MDSTEPSLREDRTAPVVTPVLRTVLLCDIVESTALVERMGDSRAVGLLQQHDQLLRQAMVLCRGQLVDKADGVLALFERPIHALEFALRYQRGLRELGQAQGLDLKARIGIHVGDVMTWANTPQDVLAGAKPFEVEGLAKPVAARLMQLALPGQILMSGMAQNLAHRAVGELGEPGARLRWLVHGRYRFKGVPAPMLVHEVGEPGLSPLRAPGSNAKAWRDVPLWRRPQVLAMEIVLAGLLLGGALWSTLRSPPAIAFNQRDWVVVADLQNRTEEAVFDDALDTALRIGLEQSRHINLISEIQEQRALERMQRSGQPIDRQLGVELALREGARAVILPTIAEVGGVMRVSLEVVDPASGVTVYSESADGRGLAGVLPALDQAMVQVRERLGEAVGSVEASSRPLELVTTDNLEALKAYSLALRKIADARRDEAAVLLNEAVRLDPEFASAWLRLAFLRYTENDATGTRRYLDQALAHRDHMTQREALFLDAAEATLDDPLRALEKFKLLATLYPDEFRAYYNYAYFAHFDALRSDLGLAMIEPAFAPQNVSRASAHYHAGVMHLARNEFEPALAAFQRAEALGNRGWQRDYAELFIARRDYAAATALLAGQTGNGQASMNLEARLPEVTLPLDRGQWAAALAAARRLREDGAAQGVTDLTQWHQEAVELLLRSYAPDPALAGDLRAFGRAQARRLPAADSLARRVLVFQVLGTAWMAAHTGDAELARELEQAVREEPLLAAYPANLAMQRAVLAELALAAGDPATALAGLSAMDAPGGTYFERALRLRALVALGRTEEALAQAEWLAANRGRAFAEASCLSLWQVAHVIESNLALRQAADLAAAGNERERAARLRRAFEEAWPDAGALAVVKRRFPVR